VSLAKKQEGMKSGNVSETCRRHGIAQTLGPNPSARMAYVVHARKSGDSKKFDEDKVMSGFSNAREAKAAFLANYSDKRFYGGMDTIPMEEFKSKVLQTKDKPQKLVRSKLEEAMEKEKLAAMGEPSTYGGGMGHIDPVPSFHPPSLKKAKRVPADDPGETWHCFQSRSG
jgi:hypothetical protein